MTIEESCEWAMLNLVHGGQLFPSRAGDAGLASLATEIYIEYRDIRTRLGYEINLSCIICLRVIWDNKQIEADHACCRLLVTATRTISNYLVRRVWIPSIIVLADQARRGCSILNIRNKNE